MAVEIRINDRPNISARIGVTRPDGIGRRAVRVILASRSRSRYWLIALAPAAESAPPIIVGIRIAAEGAPCAATIIAVTVVKISSKTIRSLASSRYVRKIDFSANSGWVPNVVAIGLPVRRLLRGC